MTGKELRPIRTAGEIERELLERYETLSPQLKKAARYLIDHPNEIAILPLRRLAVSAGVKPSTLVRVAAAIGFDSFSKLRVPFQASLRVDPVRIGERARRLESGGDDTQRLRASMARAAADGITELFEKIDVKELRRTAETILKANRKVVTAVGSAYALAHYFHYLARMAIPDIHLSPQLGSLPVDDLIALGPRDVLIALSYRPYRQETIDAVQMAQSAGAKVIAISDSRAAPIALAADIALIVPTESPQFFPSITPAVALIETILAIIVARGGRTAVKNIEGFDRMRHEFSIWWRQD